MVYEFDRQIGAALANTVVVLDPLVEKGAELEGKAFDFPVDLPSDPHLQSQLANKGMRSWIQVAEISFFCKGWLGSGTWISRGGLEYSPLNKKKLQSVVIFWAFDKGASQTTPYRGVLACPTGRRPDVEFT